MCNTNEGADRGSITRHIGATVSTLTLLGLVLYGLDYTALINFYEDFEVSPTEVGITYADALGRSAAGLLVLTFVLVPPLTLLALMFGWLIRRSFRTIEAYDGLNMRVWGISVALATTLFLSTIWAFSIAKSFQIRLILVLLLLGIHAFAGRLLANHVLRARKPKPAIDLSLGGIILLGWVIFAAIAMPLWVFSDDRGNELAFEGDRSPVSGFYSFIYGNVPCVRLTWTSSESSPRSFPKKEVLYLGEKSGMAVIADIHSSEQPRPHVQRIPLGNIVISRAADQGCKSAE